MLGKSIGKASAPIMQCISRKDTWMYMQIAVCMHCLSGRQPGSASMTLVSGSLKTASQACAMVLQNVGHHLVGARKLNDPKQLLAGPCRSCGWLWPFLISVNSTEVLTCMLVSQNVGHHLVGAGRLDDLKQLLASPGWLERKLHSYGTASAVADFRR